jgi:hypothetical protein
MAFIDGVAALCRQAPIREVWEPVSKKHAPLARRAEALLTAALKDVPSLGHWPGLVDLLWVAEAADLDSEKDRRDAILTAVRAHIALNEALFWRGVELMIEREPGLDPVRLWMWQRLERRYWTLREPDRAWLEQSAKGPDEVRSRIAFAALIALAEEGPKPAEALADLSRRYAGNAILIADLNAYLAPRPDPPEIVEYRAQQEARAVAMAKAETMNHQAWREVHKVVVGDPDRLKDESRFHAWPDFKPLVSLTNWLACGSEKDPLKAVLTYRDLESAFSPAVAEAYAAGMVRFWRVAVPKGVKQSEGRTTRPWSVVVAMAGLALDAATTPDWIGTLDPDLARRAVRHAFLSAMGLPDWLDALLQVYPSAVEPFVVKGLQQEWAMPTPAFTPLLYRAGANLPMTPGVQRALLRLIEKTPSPDAERLEQIRKILPRLTLTPAKRRALAKDTRARLQAAQVAGDWDGAMRRVPILFILDSRAAVAALPGLLAAPPKGERQARAEAALGALFGMARGRVWGLRTLPEDLLANLLRLAYFYVRPEDDRHHDGHYESDGRDEAETARNELLGALMDKPGERAYLLMRQLLAEDAFGVSTPRLHRLAQQMAETASEGGAWDAAAVVRFEANYIEPVTTGERLFALVCELIEDIDNGLRGEDVSARELLLTAKDEHAVQSWLASELKQRAQGRFTVPIEAEAPARDRLDIIVVANGGAAEVAVEMKHGGMAWTLSQLKGSLSNQLARRYLKSRTRRHGVFVVSNHRPRRWKDEEGVQIGFAQLIRRLQAHAEGLTANSSGPIHVAVRGADAVLPRDPAKRDASVTAKRLRPRR